jgi:4-alpha-glucanotransferase
MESDGQLSATDAAAERADRTRWRRAMVAATGAEAEAGAVRDEDTVNDNTAADTAADADNTDLAATVLRGCLAHLARSPAELVLVDLEELWGERQPQNRPGSGTGAANWRRRASRTLGEMNQDTDTIDFLRQLDQLRQPAESAPAKMEVTP